MVVSSDPLSSPETVMRCNTEDPFERTTDIRRGTQTELAEWHDTGRRTIYSWLKRLVGVESLEQAVTDAHRSGRKRALFS